MSGSNKHYFLRLQLVSLRQYLERIRASQRLLNLNGRDDDGFDADGFDADGFDRYGFNREGVDRAGVERWRFYGWGSHREPTYRDLADYHRIRANDNGIATGIYLDDDGFDFDGFNALGFDREGFNRFGLNRRGNPRPPELDVLFDCSSPYSDLISY